MIIFIGFFLVIIAISFVLAYRSMQDYQEIPSPEKNGVYLIQNPSSLTKELIAEIGTKAGGEVVSFERLFKGNQSALVIFGPKPVLETFAQLNLLELEEYTLIKAPKIAWEMGIKDSSLDFQGNPFASLPLLNLDEQFWWQLLLQNQDKDHWQAQIRAVVVSGDSARLKELSGSLAHLSRVIKIPRPLTSDQIYQQYLKRALNSLSKPLILNSQQILMLLGKV